MKNLKTRKNGTVFDSMKSAAGTGLWTLALLKSAKEAGCPAFRGARVHGDELAEWLKANPDVAKKKGSDLKGQKTKEEIRKLKLANDLKEGRLIERAWMAARIHIAAGKVDAFRVKSESEHPLLFAAAAGDVPKCREVVQKIWDEIISAMNSLKVDFTEKQKGTRE
jgi:hypothetical protein